MRNIYKGFQNPQAQPYVLPKADLSSSGEFDLLDPALAAELKAIEAEDEFNEMEYETAEATVNLDLEEEPYQEVSYQEPSPIGVAQNEADQIIAQARATADEILANVELQVADELELLRSAARDEGYRDGYARGMMDATEQSKEERESFGEAVSNELKEFLEGATQARERMLEDNVEELRDLAIAVAEKVVKVSLKTSSEVIVRMIQSATDKLKKREWVHIYISGCDTKGLAEISPQLSASMTGLSEHIRIIPMQDDELGTCIIETPEEIIDASLSTQISNIKNLVFDQNSGRDIGGF